MLKLRCIAWAMLSDRFSTDGGCTEQEYHDLHSDQETAHAWTGSNPGAGLGILIN